MAPESKHSGEGVGKRGGGGGDRNTKEGEK
jgi:hypothetical protein